MMSNCGLDVLEYKSVTLNPHHNFGVYCSGRDFDMILEQPKFRSQTHLKSGFKKIPMHIILVFQLIKKALDVLGRL